LDVQIEVALRNLLANNFGARFAENSDTAKKIVSGSISKNTIVGIGDSATVRQIGINIILAHAGRNLIFQKSIIIRIL